MHCFGIDPSGQTEALAWSASLLSWGTLGFVIHLIVLNDGIHDTAVIALPGVLVLAGLSSE